MLIPLIPPPIHHLCHCRVLFSTLCCNFPVWVRGVKRRGVVKEETIGSLSSVDDKIVEFEVLGSDLVSGDHRDGERKTEQVERVEIRGARDIHVG